PHPCAPTPSYVPGGVCSQQQTPARILMHTRTPASPSHDTPPLPPAATCTRPHHPP
ncbi:hypothetical protein K439DRAFT_1228794, partial [Ramaria rubella]